MPRTTDDTAASGPEQPATPLQDAPEVDPTADSTQEPEKPPVAIDNALLNDARGDSATWGKEFGRFLTALTGSTIDDASLTGLFAAYSAQVQTETFRQVAIGVANHAILPAGQSSEVLTAQMDLRSDIAEALIKAVD